MYEPDQAALFDRLPDPDARDQLFENLRPLALHLAKRYFRRGIEEEDLIQVAYLGLLNAIDRYDPAHGARFSSFAVPTITGEIKRHFRDSGWATGVPRRLKDANISTRQANETLTQRLGRSPTVEEVAELTGLDTEEVVEAASLGNAFRPESIDSPLAPDDSRPLQVGDVDERFDMLDDFEVLSGLLDERDDRDRLILHLRFEREFTQRQIADAVGISQMHVSRLLSACLDDIRTRLQSEISV